MNKRIAKKIINASNGLGGAVRTRVFGGLVYEWQCYDATRIERATRVNDRGGRFCKTLALIAFAAQSSDPEVRAHRLLSRWPTLRTRVLRELRAPIHRDLDTYETCLVASGEVVEEWDTSARSEWARSCADGASMDLHEAVKFVSGSLSYFSDRWCWNRVARMDTWMRMLRAVYEAS